MSWFTNLFKNKDRDAVRQQSEAQARIAAAQEGMAGTQAALGRKYSEQSDADRAFQQMIFEKIRPMGEGLVSGQTGYGDIARPDVSGQIKRNYAQQLADIQGNVNRDVAGSEDYATSMGLGRSGIRGMGFGAAMRGGDVARTAARGAEQEQLTGEQLAGYEDTMRRRGLDINTRLQGANVLAGQQAVFNPAVSASLGESAYSGAGGSLAGGTASRGAAAGGFHAASQMPSPFAKIAGTVAGVAGAALGAPGFGKAAPWKRSTYNPGSSVSAGGIG